MIRHGIPCVIKAGENKACELLPDIESAVRQYANTRDIGADHIRHGATGTRRRHKPKNVPVAQATHTTSNKDTEDATTLGPQGNAGSALNPNDTLRTKGCVIGHRKFTPRMKPKTKNIKLGPGPAKTYTTKDAIEAMQDLAQKLLPLTQLEETLFCGALPDEHSKYKAAYKVVYGGKDDRIDQAFGIWTSRSFVINANTNNHLDLEDICHGWCAIVTLGNFKGGNVCFPELGVKMDCPPGMFRQLGQI